MESLELLPCSTDSSGHVPAQVKGRSSYLMTVEMSSFSLLLLLLSAAWVPSPDTIRIRQLGFFHAWSPMSLVGGGGRAHGQSHRLVG